MAYFSTQQHTVASAAATAWSQSPAPPANGAKDAMKPKQSCNGTDSESVSSSVRRSLTRAGQQLGPLSQVVSGALSNLQGASPRGAAQNRMRALLSQDRALLSHRAFGPASLESGANLPELPAVVGGPSRGAAQNRMRELLDQDRALLALREARRRADPGAEPSEDDFAAELAQRVDRDRARESEPVHRSAASVSASRPSIRNSNIAPARRPRSRPGVRLPTR